MKLICDDVPWAFSGQDTDGMKGSITLGGAPRVAAYLLKDRGAESC